MDYHNKRNMILNAFKWRDNIKKKNDDELFREMFLFLVYLSFFSNLLEKGSIPYSTLL